MTKKEKEKAEAAAGSGGGGGEAKQAKKGKPTPEEIERMQAEKAAQPKKEKPAKKEAPPKDAAAGPERTEIDISWADIRVGKIVDAVPHPESDKLYVETIDLGEDAPRQILSGLAHHMKLEQVKGAMVVCICNLKTRKLGGMDSAGMVLCASNADKSKLSFVTPPAGAAPGQRVTFDGFAGEPETSKKMDKKKGWETLQPDLNTSADGVCRWKELPFTVAGGVCTGTEPKGIIS